MVFPVAVPAAFLVTERARGGAAAIALPLSRVDERADYLPG